MGTGTTTPKHSPEVSALQAENAALQSELKTLAQQLDWFKRQLFGRKSERRLVEPDPNQPLLTGFGDEQPATATVEKETVTYQRRKGKRRDEGCVTEQGLRFDDSVPIETIPLSLPEAVAGEFETISEKVTYRLAQRPAAYVVLKYIQPVVKRKSDGQIMTVPAPDGLWPGSMVDVSVVAGIVVDKFAYHLPLYRQHQRFGLNGLTVARSSLTHWVGKGSALLKPIYGEEDEIAFTFSPSRARTHVEKMLGVFEGTLLTDGAAAYARFAAERPHVTHAQCWTHTRRQFEKALTDEPQAAGEALDLIGAMYVVEAAIGERDFDAAATQAYRSEQALPAVDAFFAWADEQRQRMDLLPSQPLTKALAYAVEREGALRVYLSDASVAIDTNHLERALRPIPMGRKNWLFCWTEVGAEHVGIVQSLLCTCRLHGINPYTYLVDVLQRIAIHPDSAVEQLTPRVWKTLFADEPLRSDLALVTANQKLLQDVAV
jgi:transposase